MHGVVWRRASCQRRTQQSYIHGFRFHSRSLPATPNRAIAQLVEQEKKSFVKSSCSNFLTGLLIPLSLVRVQLAPFLARKTYSAIHIIFRGIAQWQSSTLNGCRITESWQRFLQQLHQRTLNPLILRFDSECPYFYAHGRIRKLVADATCARRSE